MKIQWTFWGTLAQMKEKQNCFETFEERVIIDLRWNQTFKKGKTKQRLDLSIKIRMILPQYYKSWTQGTKLW